MKNNCINEWAHTPIASHNARENNWWAILKCCSVLKTVKQTDGLCNAEQIQGEKYPWQRQHISAHFGKLSSTDTISYPPSNWSALEKETVLCGVKTTCYCILTRQRVAKCSRKKIHVENCTGGNHIGYLCGTKYFSHVSGARSGAVVGIIRHSLHLSVW